MMVGAKITEVMMMAVVSSRCMVNIITKMMMGRLRSMMVAAVAFLVSVLLEVSEEFFLAVMILVLLVMMPGLALLVVFVFPKRFLVFSTLI